MDGGVIVVMRISRLPARFMVSGRFVCVENPFQVPGSGQSFLLLDTHRIGIGFPIIWLCLL